MSAKKNITSALTFKLGWLACAFGAAWGYQLLGPAVVLLGFVFLYRQFGMSYAHIGFACAVAVLGTLSDSILLSMGHFSFPLASGLPWPYPFWMTSLWFNFGGLVLLALANLDGRYWLAALLGGVGGPMSYISGSKIGAVTLGVDQTVALLFIGLFWALVVPAIYFIKERMNLPKLEALESK